MKRKDLEALGLEKEAIDSIMNLHQTDVEENKKALDAKDAAITEKDTKITELTDNIKKFDGVDVEKLKNDVTAWETKYNADTANLKKSNAISLAIAKSKPKNEKALMALLDTDIIKLNDDGSVTGLQEQLDTVKKDNGFLFEEETIITDVNLGGDHQGGAGGKEPAGLFEAVAAAYNK